MTKPPIDKVKIIKELGHGIIGTVYLVSYKGKKYAMKVEHVFKDDIQDPSSPVWNEIRFTQDIANKNPRHFMMLYNYDFVDDCEHTQKYPVDLSIFPQGKQEYLKKLANSNYCVRKIYSLVDDTLNNVNLKTKEENYSMIIQLLYIIYLMRQKGYVHADLHPGNIGVLNTKEKYIHILGHKVPTFGRIYQAIDYGGVLNKKTLDPKKHIMGLPELQKDVYQWALTDDKLGFMLSRVNNKKFWDDVDQRKIKVDLMKKKDKITKAPEMKIVKAMIGKDNEPLELELFKLLFPEQFQNILLGNKFEKTIPWKYKIPLEDLIVFFIHFEDNLFLIDYFISRL